MALPFLNPDLAARLAAWWDGRAYQPSDAAEAVAADAVATPEPAAGGRLPPRVRALQTMWGVGRFGPSSQDIDGMLLTAALDAPGSPASLGLLGVDPTLANLAYARANGQARLHEWREECAAAHLVQSSGIPLERGELDRPRAFADFSLSALISVDAFAFSDHKAGLVSRCFRALAESGRWVFLDMNLVTPRAPAQAFASAFAEPQLTGSEEIQQLLETAGFRSVQRSDVTHEYIALTRHAFARLGTTLDDAVHSGLADGEGARCLQELSWEIASWRARLRAMERGALKIELWVADKSAEAPAIANPVVRSSAATAPAAPAQSLPTGPATVASVLGAKKAGKSAKPAPAPPAPPPASASDPEPLDQNAIDSLFD